MTSKGERFSAGTTVPSSGIYAAVHTGHPKQDHEVTCIRGKKFPACRDCGAKVGFILVRKAKHVKHHELFSGEVAASAALASPV
jgi:hypothetical protein